jgi:O-methyltransferase
MPATLHENLSSYYEEVRRVCLGHHLNSLLYRVTGLRLTRDPPYYGGDCDAYRVLHTWRREERWGVWSDRTLDKYFALARDLKGDFVEIGVAFGDTFHRVARAAHAQGKRAHACDSFAGMGHPGPRDRQPGESGTHLSGQFSSGGPGPFALALERKGVPNEWYRLWPGWIPESFRAFPTDTVFSLAIIDVDHYQPTKDSLQWVWPRLDPGGYLLLDDYVAGWNRESAAAITEFVADTRGLQIEDYYNNQLIVRKIPSLT